MLLEPQNWISMLPFYLKIEIQYWQFTSILKKNFNVDKVGLILSVQYWSELSMASKLNGPFTLNSAPYDAPYSRDCKIWSIKIIFKCIKLA